MMKYQYCKKSGFTLVELLTSIAITAMLLSLMLPSIQQARESARKLQCQSHLRQLGIALTSFEGVWGYLPSGPDHKYELMPYLDAARQESGSQEIDFLYCPSDPAERTSQVVNGIQSSTNYQASAGTGVLGSGFNGLFGYGVYSPPNYPDKKIAFKDITDGLSRTAAFSEAIRPGIHARLSEVWLTPIQYFDESEQIDLQIFCQRIPKSPLDYGYLSGGVQRGFPWQGGGMGNALYNHVLPPNHPSCTNGADIITGIYSATSFHHGGVNLCFADGHVDFVSQSIDTHVWSAYGSRDSGEIQTHF